MAYRIYNRVNYADTCRDKDDIRITELGYRYKLEDAKKVAEDYMKEHFFQKETELKESENGTWSATDFRSYGPTIIIEPIKIE